MKRAVATQTPAKTIRCAIYTRKSTEEGLQQDFNTLVAQRESAESYIASQKAEGWVCLPDRYDDGGFTGGNLERPAVKRLMTDIESGKIDCVVVYKVDRLSRSLMDFSRMMQTFEKHSVSFVSVTQHFNTTHSMGRLTLNILLSFAQFEREIISERTRDKIAAARRKGKFAGGRPVLGYDLLSNPTGPKLIVNPEEADQVRTIFATYLKHEALIPAVEELNRRGWMTKRWETKAGKILGGRAWGKTELFKLLTNIIYLGKVRYREEIHPGEHSAIVDPALWQRVQSVLQRNGRSGGALVRNKHGALLKGILRCSSCDCSMGHSFSQSGSKRYRYYVCLNAQKRGWKTCRTKSVPAGEIERFVVDQIRCIGSDPLVVAEAIKQTRTQSQHAIAELQSEERLVQRQLKQHNAALVKLSARPSAQDGAALARLHETLQQLEQRAMAVREQINTSQAQSVDESQLRSVLTAFDPVWETLTPREQARIVRLLVERVDYDGGAGTIALTFRPTGIRELSQELEMAA